MPLGLDAFFSIFKHRLRAGGQMWTCIGWYWMHDNALHTSHPFACPRHLFEQMSRSSQNPYPHKSVCPCVSVPLYSLYIFPLLWSHRVSSLPFASLRCASLLFSSFPSLPLSFCMSIPPCPSMWWLIKNPLSANGHSSRITMLLYLYLCISLSLYLSLYLSISLSLYLSVSLSLHPSIHPSIQPIYSNLFQLSTNLPIYLSIYPSIHLSTSTDLSNLVYVV